MSEIKDKNYSPKYDEVEKNHHIGVAISKNNAVLFEMIKDHIDSHITQRLISFRKGIPSISEPSGNSTIVDCKE